ncbi:MAG: hypothetical protein H6686_10770 [Fibrobacteria bacterium]|nr:hypothetical protein [Fibrobacteria bacterium]
MQLRFAILFLAFLASCESGSDPVADGGATELPGPIAVIPPIDSSPNFLDTVLVESRAQAQWSNIQVAFKSSVAPGILRLSIDTSKWLSVLEVRDVDSSTQGFDTLLAGLLDAHDGMHFHLARTRGKLARRNPTGWIRLEPAGNGLALSLQSMRWIGEDTTGKWTGTWRGGLSGKDTLTLSPDSSWQMRDPSGESKGAWGSVRYPDSLALSQTGLVPPLAEFLSDRNVLTIFDDPFLVQRQGPILWMDLVGDGALIYLEKSP